MLDKSYKAAVLLLDLQDYAPFEVTLPPSLIKHLANKENPVAVKSTEIVDEVFELGEFGGISCAIEADDGSRVIVSLTQVRVSRTFPFARAVIEYQKHRLKKIKKGADTRGLPGSLALLAADVAEGWCDIGL